MFELKNITKTFGGEVALKNVSLSISGGMNYIIGASGSAVSYTHLTLPTNREV